MWKTGSKKNMYLGFFSYKKNPNIISCLSTMQKLEEPLVGKLVLSKFFAGVSFDQTYQTKY